LVPLCLDLTFLKSIGRLYTNIPLNTTAISLGFGSYLDIVHEFCKPVKPLLYFMFFAKSLKNWIIDAVKEKERQTMGT